MPVNKINILSVDLNIIVQNIFSFCSCNKDYIGDRCQTQLIVEYSSADHKNKQSINALWVIFLIIVMLIVITATTYYFTKLRRR